MLTCSRLHLPLSKRLHFSLFFLSVPLASSESARKLYDLLEHLSVDSTLQPKVLFHGQSVSSSVNKSPLHRTLAILPSWLLHNQYQCQHNEKAKKILTLVLR